MIELHTEASHSTDSTPIVSGGMRLSTTHNGCTDQITIAANSTDTGNTEPLPSVPPPSPDAGPTP